MPGSFTEHVPRIFGEVDDYAEDKLARTVSFRVKRPFVTYRQLRDFAAYVDTGDIVVHEDGRVVASGVSFYRGGPA